MKAAHAGCPGHALDSAHVADEGARGLQFAVKVFDDVLCRLLERSGYTDDLACVVPHQANARIVEAVARRMGVPLEKFYLNMETTGISSAASIPVALDAAVAAKKIKEGDPHRHGRVRRGTDLRRHLDELAWPNGEIGTLQSIHPVIFRRKRTRTLNKE